MNIQINTELKQITIIGPSTVAELIECFKDFKDYTVIGNYATVYTSPHITFPNRWEYSPYRVTCGTGGSIPSDGSVSGALNTTNG